VFGGVSVSKHQFSFIMSFDRLHGFTKLARIQIA